MRTLTNKIRQAAMVGVVLAGLAALAGCDVVDPMGLGDVGGWYGGFPAVTPLYDPTETIQSVIGYRQEAMEYSANAWDEYIRE